ncbi:MAG: hypothetical protein Q8807_02930 ['Waltheria sp.' little leaf phytoplasma]|nr:hypothetical protein ['Waltheria sp.' little leaf phytoplasma]
MKSKGEKGIDKRERERGSKNLVIGRVIMGSRLPISLNTLLFPFASSFFTLPPPTPKINLKKKKKKKPKKKINK